MTLTRQTKTNDTYYVFCPNILGLSCLDFRESYNLSAPIRWTIGAPYKFSSKHVLMIIKKRVNCHFSSMSFDVFYHFHLKSSLHSLG